MVPFSMLLVLVRQRRHCLCSCLYPKRENVGLRARCFQKSWLDHEGLRLLQPQHLLLTPRLALVTWECLVLWITRGTPIHHHSLGPHWRCRACPHLLILGQPRALLWSVGLGWKWHTRSLGGWPSAAAMRCMPPGSCWSKRARLGPL